MDEDEYIVLVDSACKRLNLPVDGVAYMVIKSTIQKALIFDQTPRAEVRLEAAALAKRFHETYEKLAPQFNYKTREESKVAWDDVPEDNKNLMMATCAEILKQGS